MKHFLFSLLFLIGLFSSCSDKKTSNEALLEQDRTNLEDEIYSEKVLLYKLMKLSLQSASVEDQSNIDLTKFKEKFGVINQALLDDEKQISVTETIQIFKDYQEMKAFIKQQDEDEFPTLMESMLISSDLLAAQKVSSGSQKLTEQHQEHAVLSILAMLSSLGTDISLYECYKTNPEHLSDGEEKSLFQFYRSFLYFDKGFYYLSEADLNANIAWLEKNPKTEFKLIQSIFQQGDKNKTVIKHFLSLNYLLRGVDRMHMKEASDHEHALEDFESFVALNHELGIEHELLWIVEAYVYLEQEKNDKALASLSKLKSSSNLSTAQKQVVELAISFLKKRKKGEKNKLIDQVFIGEATSKNMYTRIGKMNSEQFLKKNKVSNAGKITELVRNSEAMMKGIKEKSGVNSMKKTTEKIEKATEDLFNKVKNSLN